MKKIFLTTIILFTFSFCLTERPTAHQLDSETAFWFSATNNVDALGADIYSNLGLDFSLSKNFEISFDLERRLGTEFSENSRTLNFRWWIGSDLSISWGQDFGSNSTKSTFLGVKFLRGDSWLAFTRDSKNENNSTWSLGKLWERAGKINVGISYHFSSDDIDKGNLQLSFGKTI